jgi:hypothetical protein
MSPGKEPAGLLAETWRWPVDVTQYDRSPELSPAERETMTRLVARFKAGGKSWHPGTSGSHLTDGTLLRRLVRRHSGHDRGNQALDTIH